MPPANNFIELILQNCIYMQNLKIQDITSNNVAPHLNAPRRIHSFAKPNNPEASP